MKVISIVAFYLMSVIVPIHDVPIAFFNLDINDGEILLNIKLDRKDTQVTLEEFYKGAFSKGKLQNYLADHLSFSVNEKELEMNFSNFRVDSEHFIIDAILKTSSKEVSQITISNNCFITSISNHSNIINITYGDEQKTYRMSKRRTTKLIKF